MSPGFHLPTALRRGKSNIQKQDWQLNGNEYKAQHILGISETALNTARNESISSSTTARLPDLSFSDATTERGSSTTAAEKASTSPDLGLKASSVLLHEEYEYHADTTSSIRTTRLRGYGSSSTLNSHYDARSIPLSISQQTSNSSRRDLALRKGAPIVVKTNPKDKDSVSRMRLFRSSKGPEKLESRKLTKPPPVPTSPISSLSYSASQRSFASGTTSIADTIRSSVYAPKQPPKGVRFTPSSGPSPKKPNVSNIQTSTKTESSSVKVNVKKPKTGTKHWFDGIEEDSSAEESVHEPELNDDFVAGMEMAFQHGKIGLLVRDDDGDISPLPSSMTQHLHPTSSRPLPQNSLPYSAIPPRTSTLNAKSSRSSLVAKTSSRQTPKPKPSSLASKDLNETSILELSSSDDEDARAAQHITRPSTDRHLPLIRDSIALDQIMESDIEIGMAKAVDTMQKPALKATPNVRKVGAVSRHKPALTPVASNRALDRALTYLSDQSSEVTGEANDLLSSFPATPTENDSRRTSYQGSCMSDNASIESRRLMSVTRQEESLLAAMRLKKAALKNPHASTRDRRVQELKGHERRGRQSQHVPRSTAAMEVIYSTQPRRQELTRCTTNSSDAGFDHASCTTFQTAGSNEPSTRFSMASFRTDTSLDPESEFSASIPTTSSNILSPGTGTNRLSRATFFSSSTNESRERLSSQTDRSKDSRHAAALDRLQKPAQRREDVTSQEFIDWPYHGWEARSTVATAH